MFQHEIPRVIERINAFLGWRAVGSIRIIQRPLAQLDKKRPPAPESLSASDEEALDITLTGIDTDRLRTALARLGRAAINEERRRR